jgi:hypothetical protein
MIIICIEPSYHQELRKYHRGRTMDLVDLERLNDELPLEDLYLLELLKLHLRAVADNPVMTALWQLVCTSFYRSRTGSVEEHELAIASLRKVLRKQTPPAWP